MARVQFASGRDQLCDVSVNKVSGNLTSGKAGTYYFWLTGRNAVGFNLPSNSTSVSVTAGDGIELTIPTDAYRTGEDWYQWFISVNTSDDPSTAKVLLVIDAVDNSQSPISLPVTITISEDSHLETEESVNSFPTGSDLLDGIIRTYNSNGKNYRYDADSTATVDGDSVISASPSGRWLLYSDGYSCYVADTLDNVRGCDTPLQLISDTRNIINFEYGLDGSPGKFRRYWVFNDATTSISSSKRLGLTVVNSGEDVSASYVGLLQTVFEGYFNRDTGSLITTIDGSTPFTYLNIEESYGLDQDNLVLERDIDENQAFVLKVYAEFDLSQLSSSDTVPSFGSELSVIPFIYTDQGKPTDLGAFFGNAILSSNPGFRRILPNTGLSVIALSGTGIVNNFFWKNVPKTTALGITPNTSSIIIAINTNGNVYEVPSLSSNEDQRALVSTLSGESKASNYSAEVEGDNNPSITFTVTYPASIRSNYDNFIGGSSEGVFNAEEIAVYIRKRNSSGGTVVETRKVTALTPTNTSSDSFTFTYNDGNVISNGSEPVLDFGLFSPTTPSVDSITNTSGGYFYEVAVSFIYDGNSITDIDHSTANGSIQEITQDFATLTLNQQYWKAPVTNVNDLSNLSSNLLTDQGTYPVKQDFYNEVALFRYDSSNADSPNGIDIIDAVNGTGNFIKVGLGSTIHYVSGTNAPLNTLGEFRDFAINDAGTLYEKTGGSTWTNRLNLKGPKGISSGFLYTATFNTPTANSIHFNGTYSLYTGLTVSNTENASNSDVSSFLKDVGIGSLIQIKKDDTNFTIAKLTESPDIRSQDVGYYNLEVLSREGSVSESDSVVLNFIPVGKSGSPPASFSLYYNNTVADPLSPPSRNFTLVNSSLGHEPSENSVTRVYLDNIDSLNSSNISNLLSRIKKGSLLQLYLDALNIMVYEVLSDSVDAGSGVYYVEVNLISISGNDWVDGDLFTISFSDKGPTGGSNGILYRFSTSTSSPASVEGIRLNNSDPSLATELYTTTTAKNSIDVTSWLSRLEVGVILKVVQDEVYAIYETSSITSSSGEYTVGITYIGSFGTFVDNKDTFLIYGEPGATGPAGTDGTGFGLKYTYSSNTSSPPSSTEIRFNNSDLTTASEIYLSEIDLNSNNIGSLLASFSIGSLLQVYDDSDQTSYYYYEITSITDNGTDWTIGVNYIAGSGTISGNVTLAASIKGDVGSVGPRGDDGFGLTYSFSTTTTSGSSSGEIRVNNSDLSLASEIYISETDSNTVSVSAVLDELDVDSLVLLSSKEDTDYAIYSINSNIVDNGTDRTIPVSYLSGTGSFIDTEDLLFSFNLKGPQGLTGDNGITGFGARYNFSTSTSSPPSSGELRFNNSTPSSVTEIYLSETDRNSSGLATLLDEVSDGSALLVYDETDSNVYHYYSLTSQTDNGTDRTFNVSYLAGNGTLAGEVSLTFAVAGPTGPTGADGVSGFGVRFTYNSATSTPPSTGELRANTTDLSLATELYVSETDRDSNSTSLILDEIVDGSIIQVFDETDNTVYYFFELTSQTDNGTDRTLTVSFLTGSGTLSGEVSLAFAPKGPAGGVSSLDDLTDVDTTTQTPSTGDGLIFGGSTFTPAPIGRLDVSQAWAAAQYTAPVSLTISSGSLTIDATASNYFTCELTEDITSITVNNLNAGSRLEIEFYQDSTGGRTVSGWPGSIVWPSGTSPSFGGSANAEEPVVSIMSRDGTVLKGIYSEAFS